MRKILTIAIVIAMAAPAVMTAENYYAYEKDELYLLIEYVEDAINAGNIQFDDGQHQTDFLTGCSALYAASTQENWSACANVACALKSAAMYIDGYDIKGLVWTLCDCVEDSYNEPEEEYELLISFADRAALNTNLNNGNLMSAGTVIKIEHDAGSTKYYPNGNPKEVINGCSWGFYLKLFGLELIDWGTT